MSDPWRPEIELSTLHQYPIEKIKALDVPYDQMNRLGIKARKGKLEDMLSEQLITDMLMT